MKSYKNFKENFNLDENHIAIAMGNMMDDESGMVLSQLEQLERGIEMVRSYIGKDYEKQLPAWVQAKITLATEYVDTVGNYLSSKNEKVDEEVELEEAKYKGLEKEDKPGKVKTAAESPHPRGVNIDTVEGWKDPKKPVAESFDNEGNLNHMSKTYKELIQSLGEIKEGWDDMLKAAKERHISNARKTFDPKTGVTKVSGHSYGGSAQPEESDEDETKAGRKKGAQTGSYKPRKTVSKLKQAGSIYK